MKKQPKQKSLKVQLIQYMIGGGGFFWSGYIAFAVFDGLFHLPLFIAKQSANLIGLSVNYVIQDRLAFSGNKKKQHTRRSRYVLITVVNLGIDYLIVFGLKELGITPYLGQFASALFFTFWNFIWYKYWVFAPSAPIKQDKRKV